MNLYVSSHSNQPIYEQLKDQIRQAILLKVLKPDEQLPSIRTLSKELSIGIITVKRAYDDLVNEGFILSRMGKGYYVETVNLDQFKTIYASKILEKMYDIVQLAKDVDLTEEEVLALFNKVKETV